MNLKKKIKAQERELKELEKKVEDQKKELLWEINEIWNFNLKNNESIGRLADHIRLLNQRIEISQLVESLETGETEE